MTLRAASRACFATTMTDSFWHPDLPEFECREPEVIDRRAHAAVPSRPMAWIGRLFGSLSAA